MSVELGTLAADPGRIPDVARAELPALIGEAAALHARLVVALSTPAETIARAPETNGAGDKLLTVEVTAERLGVSPKWVYRHQGELPVRKLSGGTLRFSEKGLVRYLEARR